MRIISQDKWYDIPYEYTEIGISPFSKGVEIRAYSFIKFEGSSAVLSMARYSTWEKSIKAMEIMQNKYKHNERLFQFPKDDEIEV